MTWDVHNAGSWGVAVTDTPADMAHALGLPASWPINAKRCFVRRDQWDDLTPTNPAPTLTSIAPTSVVAGAPDTLVTLTGTGFVSMSLVQVGANDYPPTFVSATTLTLSVPAAALAAPTSLGVSVRNPPPGGGASGQQVFTVTATAED